MKKNITLMISIMFISCSYDQKSNKKDENQGIDSIKHKANKTTFIQIDKNNKDSALNNTLHALYNEESNQNDSDFLEKGGYIDGIAFKKIEGQGEAHYAVLWGLLISSNNIKKEALCQYSKEHILDILKKVIDEEEVIKTIAEGLKEDRLTFNKESYTCTMYYSSEIYNEIFLQVSYMDPVYGGIIEICVGYYIAI